MKYVSLRDFEYVTSAINFYTNDCHVVGGCDLYTTKAAGADEKKLYKSIENSLVSHYEDLVRLSKSLSPPNSELLSLSLSRKSPFGPLTEVSARRTFAYLIATLNASHPDYDFSHLLRPSDFHREPNLNPVMNTVNETLYSLRPRPTGALLALPPSANGAAAGGPQSPGGSLTWSPRMWKLIDKEMNLLNCDIYLYSPEEDPFEDEESALWSLHYFFFNKQLKRVLYFHLRSLSLSSHSPAGVLSVPGGLRAKPKRSRHMSRSLNTETRGAGKRARYWLGDRADRATSHGADDTYDNEIDVIGEASDDEVDDEAFWESWGASSAYVSASEDDDYDANDEVETRLRERDRVRRMSEHIAESMEV